MPCFYQVLFLSKSENVKIKRSILNINFSITKLVLSVKTDRERKWQIIAAPNHKTVLVPSCWYIGKRFELFDKKNFRNFNQQRKQLELSRMNKKIRSSSLLHMKMKLSLFTRSWETLFYLPNCMIKVTVLFAKRKMSTCYSRQTLQTVRYHYLIVIIIPKSLYFYKEKLPFRLILRAN